MLKTISADKDEMKAELWGSFLLFVKTFFPIVTGRNFLISNPVSRESHFITISKELTKVARCQQRDLIINVPPGYGKSVMLSMWIAWTLSRWPDSNYLYIAYGKTLAAKHTEFIRRIIQTEEYGLIFDVHLRLDSRAKDYFQTTAGGSIKAFGSTGSITGQDAGLPDQDHRFSGAVVIDDPHKPDEVHSDTMRESVVKNYKETILQRPRGPNVPIVFIGQRLHEADLAAHLMSDDSERKYEKVILEALDAADNALYPEVNTKESLIDKRDKSPYVFSSQFMQSPIPSGGALFKTQDFVILDDEPKILMTFITADTAETAKDYNDASVFSFWGLYKIEQAGIESELFGLHWLDCVEIRVEPKHLKNEFMSFYASCMRHAQQPNLVAIEKKSTGVTLLSILEDVRGLKLLEIMRNRASGSKSDRFLEMQPFIASKLISLSEGAKHSEMCISHMTRITANNSHRNDDIADTIYDAVKIALIDKSIQRLFIEDPDAQRNARITQSLADSFSSKMSALNDSRGF